MMKAIGAECKKAFVLAKQVPMIWINVAEIILATSTMHMEWKVQTVDGFTAFAQQYNVKEAEIPNLLRYLNDVGLIWWFENHSYLCHYVFTNPMAIVKLFGTLLDQMKPQLSGAFFTVADIDKAWPDIDQEFRLSLLKLMAHVNFVFQTNEQGSKFLIPTELRTTGAAASFSVENDVVARVYEFANIPKPFFFYLASKIMWYDGAAVTDLWTKCISLTCIKNGVEIEKGRVEWDDLRNELHIMVESLVREKGRRGKRTGEKKWRLLRFLVETTENIGRGFYHAKFKVKIPCNHCLRDLNSTMAPYHFTFQQVVGALTSNVRMVQCQGFKSRQVLISSLAPDLALEDIGRNQVSADNVEMGEVLGKGGFATVYRGKWRGKEVAVKQVHTCHSDEEFSEFQREAWIMAGLKSPYLVSLYSVCFEPPMLIMEYLPFGSLYQFLEERKGEALSLNFRLKIAFDIARGMQVLSSSSPPLIHRDLKSPNVLMAAKSADDAQIVAKVTDFGLSKQISGDIAGREVFNPDWLAPEVILDKPYTTKADVFSYGVILWELVSLKHPFSEYWEKFEGKPEQDKEQAIVEGLRPTNPKNVEAWYGSLIDQCLLKDPDSRPSFDDIVSTLCNKCDYVRVLMEKSVTGQLSKVLSRNSWLSASGNQLMLSGSGHLALDHSSEESIGSVHNLQLRREVNPIKVVQRVVFEGLSPPGAVCLSGTDLFWCGMRDGTVNLCSRMGGVLSKLQLRDDCVTCIKLVGKVVWVGFRNGSVVTVTLNAVELDAYKDNRSSAAVTDIVATQLPNGVAVVSYADGTLVCLSQNLSNVVASASLKGVSCRCLTIHHQHDPVLLFVGDDKGFVHVFSLPSMSKRGSFRASESAVSAISMYENILWVGCANGLISLFKVDGNISSLPHKHPHQSSIVSVIPLEQYKRIATVSEDGHICWWSTEDDIELEWEMTGCFTAHGSEVLSDAAHGGGDCMVACEVAQNSLTFLRITDEAIFKADLNDTDQQGQMKALLENTDKDIQLYIAIQQYRQCLDDRDRFGLAKSIYQQFFEKDGQNKEIGVSREVYDAVKKSLASTLKANSTMGLEWFDNLATFIFAKKRRRSLVDVTKTVFFDLCAKGIELRSLSYDVGLLDTFVNLCEGFDSASWKNVKVKTRVEGKKTHVDIWEYYRELLDEHCYTGKSRIVINAPAEVVLECVSRPEHKLKWESLIQQSKMIKEFSKDFYILYSTYKVRAYLDVFIYFLV